jgi:cytochrome c6
MPKTKSTFTRLRAFATTAVFLAALFLAAVHGQLNADTSARSAAKATFSSKCAMCHGADGAGSQVGKTMNVPDLRSPAIQKTAEAQLADIIANGKNGMPSFKGSLSADEIHELVGYIHSLAGRK